MHASICNISIAQPTGPGYNVTDRLINKHHTATCLLFDKKYFKGNFALLNTKNSILYNLDIISREKKNQHIQLLAKRLNGNISLTNGFGCNKYIELFYIKFLKNRPFTNLQ